MQSGEIAARDRNRSFWKRALLLSARLTGIIAAMFFVGFVVFAGLVQKGSKVALDRADGIVVLTGGEARIAEALKLLQRGYAKRLLISGVNPATTKLELVRLNPQNASLFKCCVDLDQNAINTVSNAEETASWAHKQGFRSLIVVTSSYHMPRSLVELRREFPHARLIPYPIQPPKVDLERWWGDPVSLRILISEYLKLYPSLARYVAARMLPPQPGKAAAGSNACAKVGSAPPC